MMEWQPIETAPKETWVLIFTPCGGIFEAICSCDGWQAQDPSDNGMSAVEFDITHWMSLPEEPETEE